MNATSKNLYVAAGQYIVEINPGTNAIVTEKEHPGANMQGIVWDPLNSYLYVGNNSDNHIYLYNGSLDLVSTISLSLNTI